VNGSGDSGVTSRMFGTFLSWLNDHTFDVFVVCTAIRLIEEVETLAIHSPSISSASVIPSVWAMDSMFRSPRSIPPMAERQR